MAKEKGMGKGLSALLGEDFSADFSTPSSTLPVSQIESCQSQPRKSFDREKLEELADSIRQHGLIQPLTVRKLSSGYYQIIAGERRWRAARLAGLAEVPCLVVAVDPTQSSLLALIENVQRRDLDFWEEALALQALLEATHLSQEALARQIGKSQSAVANKLRLLKLSPAVLSLLREAGLTERHARALLPLTDPAMQEEAARHAAKEGLTVAKTEAYVAALLSPPPQRSKPTIIIKDVRLFLNTVKRGLDLMQTAGVAADCQRKDTDREILLTIRIPRQQGA